MYRVPSLRHAPSSSEIRRKDAKKPHESPNGRHSYRHGNRTRHKTARHATLLPVFCTGLNIYHNAPFFVVLFSLKTARQGHLSIHFQREYDHVTQTAFKKPSRLRHRRHVPLLDRDGNPAQLRARTFYDAAYVSPEEGKYAPPRAKETKE